MSVVLADGFETSVNIVVTENMGAYKGGTAEWEVACKVELIEKFIQE